MTDHPFSVGDEVVVVRGHNGLIQGSVHVIFAAYLQNHSGVPMVYIDDSLNGGWFADRFELSSRAIPRVPGEHTLAHKCAMDNRNRGGSTRKAHDSFRRLPIPG